MTGVYAVDVQSFQFFDTGLCCRWIVDDVPQIGFLDVGKQIATEQITVGRQEADGASGMAGQTDHLGLESVACEIVSGFDKNVRRESFGFAKPKQPCSDDSEQGIAAVPVAEHVAARDHPQITMVHGDIDMVCFAEMGGIAAVVEVAVGEDDELEIARLTASLLKVLQQFSTLV
jgi:hypothetical protein